MDARSLPAGLAAAALFSWFFERMFLPGPTGALLAGVIAGDPALPLLAPLLFFLLGLLFGREALSRYLPVAALSFLPLFLAGAGLTALVLSFFVRDVPSLIAAALGAGAGAPLLIAYAYRKSYAEGSRGALLTSAVLTLSSMLFVFAFLASSGSAHFVRVLAFAVLLLLFAFLGGRVEAKSGEHVLFMLALGYMLGDLLEGAFGTPAYFLGGVLASHALQSSPRPLRKAVLGGITLLVFLALGAHARVFSMTSLAVFLAVLAARILYYVVAHRFILPGTFVAGRDRDELSMNLLPTGAPFLYALAQSSPPDVYSGALVATAILQGVAHTSGPARVGETRLEFTRPAPAGGDWRPALAFLSSLAVAYMLLPLSAEHYWIPFALVVPFCLAVHFLRQLVRSVTGRLSDTLPDAYLLAYAFATVSLAVFALLSLRPAIPYVLASAALALVALHYLRYTARLFVPRRRLYW